jgi:hypothetical protein
VSVARKWGYSPDPVDARDRPLRMLLGATVGPPPPSASVEHRDVHAKDQGPTGSCTGQAWAQAIRLGCLHVGRPCPDLSALFSYYTNRAELGLQHEDNGAYLRTGAAAAVKLGIAPEQAWPFNPDKVNTAPGYSAVSKAYALRGSRGYHRVDLRNVDDVRRAIAAGFAVVGGWQVDEAFEAFNGFGVIGKPNPAKILGGHALPITSYGADGTFRVLNSWGSYWGLGGYGLCSAEWVASGTDGWVVDVGGAT